MIYSVLLSTALMTPIAFNMGANAWSSINDGVMGGLSSGDMILIDDDLRFSGELSLEHGPVYEQ